MKKLPARFSPYLFTFCMAFCMSGIMSLVLTFINLGPVPDFISRWLRAFSLAFPIAWPTVIVVAPIVTKIVGILVASPNPPAAQNSVAPSPEKGEPRAEVEVERPENSPTETVIQSPENTSIDKS